eukprot:1160349-Pelagomonas_calceolata.AAC.7
MLRAHGGAGMQHVARRSRFWTRRHGKESGQGDKLRSTGQASCGRMRTSAGVPQPPPKGGDACTTRISLQTHTSGRYIRKC